MVKRILKRMNQFSSIPEYPFKGWVKSQVEGCFDKVPKGLLYRFFSMNFAQNLGMANFKLIFPDWKFSE